MSPISFHRLKSSLLVKRINHITLATNCYNAKQLFLPELRAEKYKLGETQIRL